MSKSLQDRLTDVQNTLKQTIENLQQCERVRENLIANVNAQKGAAMMLEELIADEKRAAEEKADYETAVKGDDDDDPRPKLNGAAEQPAGAAV